MKIKTKECRIVEVKGGYALATMIPNSQVDELKKLCDKDVDKTIEVKQYREKRSLDANAYFWKLCGELAKVMDSTDKEIYIQLLIDYGVNKYKVVHESEVNDYLVDYKHVEVMNLAKVKTDKGVTDGVQIRCTRGSSKYNTKQMSRLIEGTVNECKDQNIEPKSPAEIKRLVDSYEGSK